MQLDTVLTVAIGGNTVDGTPLSRYKWARFRRETRALLEQYGTVVAQATGRDGVGSDGVNNGAAESTAIFITINTVNNNTLRVRLAQLLRKYEQSSACFSLDVQHEPVFNTLNGWRA